MCTEPIFETPLAIWIENTYQAKRVLARLKELGFTWNGGNKIDLYDDLNFCTNSYIVISQLNVILKRENNYLYCDSKTQEKFRYDLENCHIIDDVVDLEDYLVNQPENNNTELPNQSDDSDNQTVTLFYSKENAHPHLEMILEYYTNFNLIEKVQHLAGCEWYDCDGLGQVVWWPSVQYRLVYKPKYKLVLGDNLVMAKSYDKASLVEKMKSVQSWLDKEISIRVTGEES